MSDQGRGAESLKSVFVDNRDGNTLARAITSHLAPLRQEGQCPAELCVASCYFNPHGLELIASEARRIPHIWLMLGADPTPVALLPRRTPYDPTEPESTRPFPVHRPQADDLLRRSVIELAGHLACPENRFAARAMRSASPAARSPRTRRMT